MRRSGDRAWLILAVVLGYAAFVALRLSLAHGDPSVFVVAGDRFVDVARLDAPIAVLPHSTGLDGQFAYRLAIDPFTTRPTDHGITLDTPALRAQRIGYPLIAHLLSFGSPRLVATSLVVVNMAALALLTGAAIGLASMYRRPAWHGLAIALYPGLLVSLACDTAEIVSTALAVSAVWMALRGRSWTAGLIACAAVLTRETTLLYLGGFGAVAAWRMLVARRADPPVLAFLLPVATVIAWQAVLFATWGGNAVAELGSHDLALPPFRYLIAALADDIAGASTLRLGSSTIYRAVMKLALIGQVATVAASLRRTAAIDWRLVLPWGGYLILASLFTDAIWAEPFGYLRVGVDLYVAGCLVLLASPGDRLIRGLIGVAAPLWLLSWGYA